MYAQKKLGVMLEVMEKNKGAKGVGPIAVTHGNRNAEPPTLAELGISKRLSVEAQLVASLPADQVEALASGEKTLADVKRE